MRVPVRGFWRSLVVWAVVSAAAGSGCSTDEAQGTFSVESLALEPASVTVAVAQKAELKAVAMLGDGTTRELLADVAWRSSDASIVAVDAYGNVTGIAPGTVTVSAERASAQATASVTVLAPTLDSVEITPTPIKLQIGGTAVAKLTGHYSNGLTADLTATAEWTSDAEAVATVAAGVVTAVSIGTANVTASFGGQSATVPVTVTDKTVLELTISPSPANVSVGGTVQLTATARFADGTRDVTANPLTTWTSKKESIFTVDATGKVTGVAVGTAKVIVTYNGKPAATDVVVTAP